MGGKKLTQELILKRVFDETKDQLAVDADVTTSSDLQVVDRVNTDFVEATVTVDNLTEVEIKVGSSALTERKLFIVTNLGSVKLFYGKTPLSTTLGEQTFLSKNQFFILAAGPNDALKHFMKTASGTTKVNIKEYA